MKPSSSQLDQIAEIGTTHAELENMKLHLEIKRLQKIVGALMNRAERDAESPQNHFSLFQDTVVLENHVRRRTDELETAVRENQRINRDLQREREQQRILIKKLETAHNQLLQSEKLASIGQLAAGVAHEINNPIGFVHSNLGTMKAYIGDLFRLLDTYSELEADAPAPMQAYLSQEKQRMDFAYMRQDIVSLVDESIEGTARVSRIVKDLRDFSRIGNTDWQAVDLCQALESTLNLLGNEIQHKADVVRHYEELPLVECMPFQINQVFLNLLLNAAQAISGHGCITLSTARDGDFVRIAISDTGEGIAPEIRERIFDPFFTTKPIGKASGLGLSVAYGIIISHGGRIDVDSQPGSGTTFTLRLPIRRTA